MREASSTSLTHEVIDFGKPLFFWMFFEPFSVAEL